MKQKPKETWILNGILLTQNQNRDLFRGSILIRDNKIQEVIAGKPKKISPRAKKIQAQNWVILPGFIQTHLHLCQTLFRNLADDLELLDWLSEKIWKFEASHTRRSLRTSAQMGISELLSSGTTCILDMGTTRYTEELFRVAQETGIRANIGKCLMDRKETNPPYLREETSHAISEAEKLFLKWNGKENDRLRASFAPRFLISCTEKLLHEVAQKSRVHNAMIHTHASENPKEVQMVRKLVGDDNISYFERAGLASSRLILAHCVWLKETEIEILKETGTRVTHCPSSNLKLASGLAPVPKLIDQGILVSLGADGAACNNHLDMFSEMRLAALIHKPGSGPRAMNAQDVLDLATRNGAQALHWEDQIGSIEGGKKADLIALDLSQPENFVVDLKDKPNPSSILSSIVYASQAKHVIWTMVDGKLLYQNGKIPSLPRSRLIQDVGIEQKKLLQRAKRLSFI